MMRLVLLASKPLGLRCARVLYELAPETLAAVVTIDDRKDSRSAYDDLLAFGRDNGVRVEVASGRRETEEMLLAHRPDLVLVTSWYWFLSEAALAAVPRGFIGVHFSLLPKYRGGSPLVWAILRGEREAGVSFFTLTPGVDEGDLWGQRAFPIPPDAYIDEVLATAEKTSLEILREIYPSIENGTLRPWPQVGTPTVVPMRKPSDGAIDWRLPARALFDFVRAQSRPYPGAFAVVDGEPVRIWRARPGGPAAGGPGDVVAPEMVVCGDGLTLAIEEAERPGVFRAGLQLATDRVRS